MTIKKENLIRKKIKIAVVEDHAMVRQGLIRLIQDEPDFTVCGEAADGHQGLKLMNESKPDIAIIDLGLQEMSGLELIKSIKIRHPRLPILVISMHDESVFAERVLRAGAKGYIMKKESAEKVVGAIRRILSGKTYLSDKMTERMLTNLSDGVNGNHSCRVIAGHGQLQQCWYGNRSLCLELNERPRRHHPAGPGDARLDRATDIRQDRHCRARADRRLDRARGTAAVAEVAGHRLVGRNRRPGLFESSLAGSSLVTSRATCLAA